MLKLDIHGEPGDPDCLHCQVAPLVQAAYDAGKPAAQICGELLQGVADIVASTAEDPEQASAGCQALLARLIHETLIEYRKDLRARLT